MRVEVGAHVLKCTEWLANGHGAGLSCFKFESHKNVKWELALERQTKQPQHKHTCLAMP